MPAPGTDEFRELKSPFPDDMVGLANSTLPPVLTLSTPNENVAADVVVTTDWVDCKFEFPTLLNRPGEGVTPNFSLIITTFGGAVLMQLTT